MKVAIFVHDPDGDMRDATIIGPFASWGSAERFRDELYPITAELQNYEAILVPMEGPQFHARTCQLDRGNN